MPQSDAMPETTRDDLWGGIFWVREGNQMVSATPGQSAAEIARLREKIAYLRNAIRNLIDGDV